MNDESMNDERQLRVELRQFADRAAAGPAPVAEVVRRGTAIRRRLRLLRGAIGAAVVVGSVVLAVELGDRGTRPGPSTGPLPAVASHPSSTEPPTLPPPPSLPSLVRTVAPEERVTTEGGDVMWLTAAGQHVIERAPRPGGPPPGTPEIRNVLDGNQVFGTINIRMLGRSDGALYTGAFRYEGTSAPARVAMNIDGRNRDAHVLTLADAPGWAVYYLDGPLPPSGSPTPGTGGVVSVVAYTADGTVLAGSHRPASTG
ncbi:hypothetical protein [Embleya sp. MST-111070]|uniref:hypothetical protein n=1 Tax=Embleya sp. MST-111070 TaxID=3398231 RepID=UPI003F73A093